MKNIFNDIPEDLRHEVFETLVKSAPVTIERIISKGHSSPDSGWYDQEREEWVIVLKGEAGLSFEDGDAVTLRQGDYIHIPAHRKHRVEWTSPAVETIWLAVHY